MALVAGVDSSTQSCKVVVRDAGTGELIREGRATHPDGTEVHPDHWWTALHEAAVAAGGLSDVSAIAVGGQQHGMVALAESGDVVRPALLWNDTRSAPQAEQLVVENGGPAAWAAAVGSVPVASFTVTKLAWLAQNEPENAALTAAVCLPHDWLTWRLAGFGPDDPDLSALRTDRGDASGTGYFSPSSSEYRTDLLVAALGHDAVVPYVLGPAESAGKAATIAPAATLGPGTGDNAAAALGVGAASGDVIVSIGTSGVVSAISEVPANDPSGAVAGFADATGRFLPLVCTLNAARVLEAAAHILNVDFDALSRLALSAPPGCDGLVLVPYLEGERTPNKPDATAAFHGLTFANATPECIARAACEGLLCGLADGIDALADQGTDVGRVVLIGGGASSAALRRIAPTVLGHPVLVPSPSEYVADGAARQAAWVLSGSAEPPEWPMGGREVFDGEPVPAIRERYAGARELTLGRLRQTGQ
jgi:xylulokinase